MDLQQLIDRGEEMKSEPDDSPIVGMWQNDVTAAVSQYGEATKEVLERAMWSGVIATSDYQAQQLHIEMINKVQRLLTELQKRDPNQTQAQSQLITQKKQEAQATLKAKFGNTTINGPVTFGDNSPANNVQVGELMLAIISQAESSLPDGPEKNKILQALKSVVANPTFAAVAGVSLPEIIKHLFN